MRLREVPIRLAARAASGPALLVIGFLWAFAEATLFFIVADVLVGWIALHSGARRATKAVLAALAGATLGGLVLYAAPGWFLGALPHVPGVTQGALDRVGAQVAEDGWRAMFAIAWTGIPYKVVGTQVAASGVGLPTFFAATVGARLLRFAPVALVFFGIGRALRRVIATRPGLTMALYFGFWVLAYVYYFGVIVPRSA